MQLLRMVVALAVALVLSLTRADAQTAEPGWLGLKVETVTPKLMQEQGLVIPSGAYVVEVEPGSPAAAAGFSRGDVILYINTTQTNDRQAFEGAIGAVAIGTKVDLVRARANEAPAKITVVLSAPKRPLSGAAVAVGEPQLLLDTGGHRALIRGLAFTHGDGGRHLVSAGDDKVIRVSDWREGKTVRTLHGQIGDGSEGKLFAMALSPDDRWLAVGGWMKIPGVAIGHVIRLYDFRSGELKTLLKGHTGVVVGLAFSGDGRRLISGGHDKTAIIWDIETAQPLLRLEGHTDDIYAVGFTPDGERAVTGSIDTTLRLWRVNDGGLIAELKGHGARVYALAVSPKDGVIASSDLNGEIRLWEGETGRFLGTLARQGTEVVALRFSPDGRWLLSGVGEGKDYNVHVWEMTTSTEKVLYTEHDDVIVAVDISPDGRWAATGGGSNNVVHVWNLTTGERARGGNGRPLVLEGTGRSTWAAGFSADGRRIAWGTTSAYRSHNDRGPIAHQLTLPREGQTTLSRPEPATDAASFLHAREGYESWRLSHKPGGNYGKNDAVLIVAKEGAPPVEILRDLTNGYRHWSYTFTPDGTAVVSGGSNGHLIAYGLDGKVLANFVGHEGDVLAVAPSHDGRLLISASFDQTVRLWPLAPLKGSDVGPNKRIPPIVTLFHGRDGEWVMWTPQGYFAASPQGEELVGWQLNKGADKSAEYITASQLRRDLLRPDIVARAIILADADAAVREANPSFNLADLIVHRPPFIRGKVDITAADQRGYSRLTLALAANSAPVQGVDITVNGRKVEARATAKPATFVADDATDTVMAFEVPLMRGENVIWVIARNEFGTSQPLKQNVRLSGPGPLNERGTLYIVAIGVDRYPQAKPLLDLNYAGRDAEAFAKIVAEKVGGRYGKVVPTVLSNGGKVEPTRDNILKALEGLKSATKDNDLVVVFLAGHGERGEGGKYVFLPTDLDRSGSTSRNIVEWSLVQDAVRAANGLKLLFVDTCRSGSVSNPTLLNDAAAGDFAVFVASKQDQVSKEDSTLRHGVFTWVSMEGLKGKADELKQGIIRINRFSTYLSDQVIAKTNGRQEPEAYFGRRGNDILVELGR